MYWFFSVVAITIVHLMKVDGEVSFLYLGLDISYFVYKKCTKAVNYCGLVQCVASVQEANHCCR